MSRQETRDRMMTAGGVRWWTRDALPVGDKPYYGAGIAQFANLDGTTLAALVDAGFADPDESQDEGPTIRAVLAFLRANPRFRAEGYVVEEEREDFRVTVTEVGMPGQTATPEEVEVFQAFIQPRDGDADAPQSTPDELETEPHLRAWWD